MAEKWLKWTGEKPEWPDWLQRVRVIAGEAQWTILPNHLAYWQDLYEKDFTPHEACTIVFERARQQS